MLRPWTPFVLAAATLWTMRVAGWTQSGTWSSLTVGDALGKMGLPEFNLPPTDLGELAGDILATDGGVFCLLLAMAALALEAVLRRQR